MGVTSETYFNVLDIADTLPNITLTQVKLGDYQCKNGINKLPHEFPNGLRLTMLRKLGNFRNLNTAFELKPSAQSSS